MKQIYEVWDPETSEQDDAKTIHASCPEVAAELYAKARHGDDDYPETRTVCVCASDGKLTRWTVEARPSVEFHAVVIDGRQGARR
jgi:hypothetical protein